MRDFQSHQKWPPKVNFTMYEGKQKNNNNTYVFKQLMNCFLLPIKGRLLILLPVCPSLSPEMSVRFELGEKFRCVAGFRDDVTGYCMFTHNAFHV